MLGVIQHQSGLPNPFPITGVTSKDGCLPVPSCPSTQQQCFQRFRKVAQELISSVSSTCTVTARVAGLQHANNNSTVGHGTRDLQGSANKVSRVYNHCQLIFNVAKLKPSSQPCRMQPPPDARITINGSELENVTNSFPT